MQSSSGQWPYGGRRLTEMFRVWEIWKEPNNHSQRPPHLSPAYSSIPWAGETPGLSFNRRSNQGCRALAFRGQKTCYSSSVIYKCVICHKLWGKQEEQHMADLPPECLGMGPPFTYVGLDVFEPWTVITRWTKGRQAQTKRWAIMFSCMSSGAVHIKVIECLDTSSCKKDSSDFWLASGMK